MPRKVNDRSDLLSKEEMDRLINVVSGNLYFSSLYKLLRYTGRRIGEIYGTPRGRGNYTGGIKLKDIDFNNNTMKTVILKNKKRKLEKVCSKCNTSNDKLNKRCRECGEILPEIDKNKLIYTVPNDIIITLREDAADILKVFINNHKPKFKDNDYIFREYSLVYLKKIIKKHMHQASINKMFSLHGFRTYWVSNMIKNGLTENQIILWSGHKSISSLGNYNRLVPKDIEKRINEVDL